MPTARVNGVNLSYTVEGDGEPLVLIIGLGSDRSNWRFQTAEFRKRYRTITFDNRGAGASDKPPGPYTIRLMVDDLHALLDHLGVAKAHVLGVSMGGMIAQEFAVSYPERVGKLILGSTFTRSDEKSGFTPKIARAVEEYAASPREETLRRTISLILDSSFNKPTYRLLALPLMKAAISFASLRGVGEQLEAIRVFDAADRLSSIRAPTLVIVGTGDRVIKPSSSEVIASLVPGTKLIRVEGGSHGFSGEMSAEFNREVLGFLEAPHDVL